MSVKAYWEKKEVVRGTLIRGCWHREVGNGITRSRASYVIGLETYLAFLLVVPELELGCKMQVTGSSDSDYSGATVAETMI